MSRCRCVIKPTLLSLCCSAASVFKASSKSNKSYGQIIYFFCQCAFRKIFQIHVGLKISVALTVNSEFIPQTKSYRTITSKNVNARDFCTFYHFCVGILIDRYVGDYFITFNFLVGAHPDPSIVCSRNKLKDKESILLSF
jgi:hypothetical protein